MSNLAGLFNDFINSKALFKSRDILGISFHPEKIPHREKQIEDVGRLLAPALKGGRPSNLFIYGKTGTGKTVVCEYVTNELMKVAEKAGQSVKVVYVNCKLGKQADTEYRLIAHLSKSFGKEVPFTGLPTEKIYQEFFNGIDQKEQIIIIILDEIDTLVRKTGDEVLYNLTRMNQYLKKAKVSIIGITNELGFIDKLDPRVKSSLSEEEMLFPPYDALQLTDILKERSKMAFDSECVEDGVIEKCAAIAAQEHGDARKALDLLRVAAELSERKGEIKVSIESVDRAQEKIDTDRVIETIKAQPKQSQAILYAILKMYERGGKQKDIMNKRLPLICTGDIFEQYSEICKNYGLTALTNRRVSDLIAELDLFGIISTKIVSKGRYGRTRTIELNLGQELLVKVKTLLDDIFK